jgi:hypothetical protein
MDAEGWIEIKLFMVNHTRIYTPVYTTPAIRIGKPTVSRVWATIDFARTWMDVAAFPEWIIIHLTMRQT